jgi:hypothetical protein
LGGDTRSILTTVGGEVGWGGAVEDHGAEVDRFGGLWRSESHQGKSMTVVVDWRCAPAVMAQTRGRVLIDLVGEVPGVALVHTVDEKEPASAGGSLSM